MTTRPRVDLPGLVSVADYLEGERTSDVRHEYLGGVIYAMAGGTQRHARMLGAIYAALWNRLRGKPCQPFGSDMKVRVQSMTQTRFYYPDVSVVCTPNGDDATWQDRPVLLAEVLSDATRRTDEGEKKDAYLTIPSLQLYLLIEPDRPAVVAFRRGEQGFAREVHGGLDAAIPVPDLDLELPLAELYAPA
jgi:Uma2 family endonuclease